MVPTRTVTPSASSAVSRFWPSTPSTASFGFSGFGRRILMKLMSCGWHAGRRASVTFRQALTWNVHTPSDSPSASQLGSPSMHACVVEGKPPVVDVSWTAHSSPQPVFGRFDAGTNTTLLPLMT